MQQLFIHENSQKYQAKYYVTDVMGELEFIIEGKTNRLRDIIRIMNLDGQTLFKAKQRVISPFPTFDIFDENKKTARFCKHPGFFNFQQPYYTLSPQKWKVTGDFKAERYELRDSTGYVLLHIQKCMTSRGNQFVLVMDSNERAAFYSLLAVLIDHYARNDLKNFNLNKEKNLDFGLMNFELLKPPTTKKQEKA